MSVWLNEQTCPMCSFPLTVSGGVSMAKTSPRDAERSNLYYARDLPLPRPPVLDAVKRRLARHEAGLLRSKRMGVGTHAARVAQTEAEPSLVILGALRRGAPRLRLLRWITSR